MMHESEKSDPSIRAKKPANNPGQPGAEPAEQREGTEGNTGTPRTRRTQSRVSVSPGLDRVRQAAKQDKKERFTALLHHVTPDLLKEAFFWLKREAAPGVDGQTGQGYKQNLEANLVDLHRRIHQGTYRALPPKRRYIPKPDGRQRPLGIAALEDKIARAGRRGGAQCHLRRRLLGVLVRVSTGTRPARCAGRASGRDYPHEGELDRGR